MCFREPLVEIRDGDRRTIYGDVDGKRAKEIYERHIVGGEEISEYMVYKEEGGCACGGDEQPFLEGQERIVLRNCGLINPESLEEYEARGGYEATRKADSYGGLTGPDRAMLYTVAAYTGLRRNELATLTPADFSFYEDGTATVTVKAANSKHRKEDVVPIRRVEDRFRRLRLPL